MMGEAIAAVLVLLLALYGCAQLVRRVCLWLTRCPGCVWCCRVAVPRSRTALAPLLRCLESQAVWDEWGGLPAGCRHTLLLLPNDGVEQETLVPLLREAPSVTPVTVEQLAAMLQQVAAEETEKKENEERSR